MDRIALYARGAINRSLARRQLGRCRLQQADRAHDASADPFRPVLPTVDVTGKRCFRARAQLRGAHSAAVLASLIVRDRRNRRANVTDAGSDFTQSISLASHFVTALFCIQDHLVHDREMLYGLVV